MEITFNKYLDNSEAAVREFKVSDKNTGEEIAVEDSRLTNNDMTVIVDLAGELKTDSEYNLTVIPLNAKDGSNIEAGVEGTRSFVTPLELFTRVETDEPEAPKDEVVEPEVELNAAPAQAKNLPQTGAQEVIVLFLAMALAGLIFVRRKA
jgi:LPXTG-motif cell wall-anchored protein